VKVSPAPGRLSTLTRPPCASAIVYWRFGGTGYMASVHYDSSVEVAEAIARGLIKKMVACQPRDGHRHHRTCRGLVTRGASLAGARTR
jgi:hypothetical protein